ncbi:MAG: phenylacetate-CoA oxygenase subunit PaaJ [Chloroflexi bacterium]|nr:phenylacetate-CoA oxygenase subunit PaaJ [Chloroflexota bacterium]
MTLTSSDIWIALHSVKDPEIPVVSLVEMGIVREVKIENDKAIITITPTFAGCPAMHVMKRDVEERVGAMGVEVEVRTSLTPPWTSDWISDGGRAKLKSFGLAPPLKHNGDINVILLEESSCPRCNSKNTTIKNTFGPTLCRAIFYCNECQEAFEQFKAL